MTCSAQSCPIGYYCSTSFTPQPVCCLSSSYGATCPPGMIGYTAPGTTGVQTCASATDSSCPTGFRCVGKASGYACCAAENLAGCANGRQRYISPVSQGPQFCTVELPSCPQGYACSPSTLFAQMICCASSVSNTGTTPVTVAPTPSNTDICPSGYPPLPTFGGIAAICSATTPCPNGYSCLPSLTRPNVNVCCASTNFVTTPYPVAPQTQYPGVSQTQVPTEVYPTCLTGGTPAFVPGTTDRRHCSPQSQFVQCPTGYNCEPSTVINEYICCTPGTHGPALRCTYPAIEYRANANDVAVECTTNPSDCSGGSICETAANVPDRKVCCIAPGQPGTGTTGTGTSQQNNVCQNGKKPLLTSDRSPLQCRASSSLSCAYGYDCERNGQDGLYYCCGAETPGPTVTSAPVTSVPGTGGVEGGCPERTYALVNAMGAPQTCHVGSPNACPQGFQCVFSIPYLRWQCCSVLSTSFVSPTTKDIRQTTAMIITAPSTTTRRMGHVGTPCLSEQRCFDANAYCIPRVEHCACRPGYMLSGPLECVPEGLVGG